MVPAALANLTARSRTAAGRARPPFGWISHLRWRPGGCECDPAGAILRSRTRHHFGSIQAARADDGRGGRRADRGGRDEHQRFPDADHPAAARSGRACQCDHGVDFRAGEPRDRGGQRLWRHPGRLHPRPLGAAEQLGQLGGLLQAGRLRAADAGLARRSGNG